MSKEIDKYIDEIKVLAQKSKVNAVDLLHKVQVQLEKGTESKSDSHKDQQSMTQDAADNSTNIIDEQERENAWENVLLARHQDRPNALAYIDFLSDHYIELHGDRYFGDDPALIGGICSISGIHFTFLAHQKGANMKENMKRNYGMAHPEGYRKALRLAKQAERFSRPILTLIDTSGAYPGLASEERGIGEAIAQNLMQFSLLEVPIICIIIGEGGSGGAIGIGVGDKIFMLENAVYSVISPEGCASILLRDTKRMKEAAQLMKMTAKDVLSFGFIDGIIPEHGVGAHVHFEETAQNMKDTILTTYKNLKGYSPQQLTLQRSKKIIGWTRDMCEVDKNGKPLLQKLKDFFGE